MSKESKTDNRDALLTKLQRARTVLDECIASLEGRSATKPRGVSARPAPSHKLAPTKLDFDAHERAFIKAHAWQLSGPRKFVLLLAYMTKGQAGKEVQLKDIEKHWNKMTAPNLLDGNFNRFYTNSAKESGWVNTKKQGIYFLRPQWRDIF